jgi:hypothetical protein
MRKRALQQIRSTGTILLRAYGLSYDYMIPDFFGTHQKSKNLKKSAVPIVKSENKIDLFCPFCLEPVRSLDDYCPYCKKVMHREKFTIYNFLLNNGLLFAVIGVVATLTALLPTIAEKFYPGITLSALPWPQNFFLLASVVLNSLMITFIFTLIFLATLEKRENEKAFWHYQKNAILRFTEGDGERIIFYLFFLTPIFFSIVFISNIFPTLRDLIINLYCWASLLVLIVFVAATRKTDRGRFLAGISCVIILIILIGWIFLTIASIVPKPLPPLPPVIESDVEINYDTQYFTTSTPATFGIGLTPANLSTLNTRNFSSSSIIWNTNYGYFANLDDNGRMKILGNSTIHDQNKIFWTHSSNDINDFNKSIRINLLVNDTITKKTIANKTISLKWIDNDLIGIL